MESTESPIRLSRNTRKGSSNEYPFQLECMEHGFAFRTEALTEAELRQLIADAQALLDN
jgi:hypothetical protein